MKKILLSSIAATVVTLASDGVTHIDIDNSDSNVIDTCWYHFMNLDKYSSGGPDKTLPWTYPMIF